MNGKKTAEAEVEATERQQKFDCKSHESRRGRSRRRSETRLTRETVVRNLKMVIMLVMMMMVMMIVSWTWREAEDFKEGGGGVHPANFFGRQGWSEGKTTKKRVEKRQKSNESHNQNRNTRIGGKSEQK